MATNAQNQHESEKAKVDAVFEMVVGAAYEVGNVLGAGFLEKVYERGLGVLFARVTGRDAGGFSREL